MSSRLVQGTIVNLSGAPVAGVEIIFALPGPIAVLQGIGELVPENTQQVTFSAPDGTFSISLIPNSEITPAGSKYTVTKQWKGRSGSFSIVVPPLTTPYPIAHPTYFELSDLMA